MRKFVALILATAALLGITLYAQDAIFKVKVDMVVLSFTVTDSKGKYVNGLKYTDFRVLEDGIIQTRGETKTGLG